MYEVQTQRITSNYTRISHETRANKVLAHPNRTDNRGLWPSSRSWHVRTEMSQILNDGQLDRQTLVSESTTALEVRSRGIMFQLRWHQSKSDGYILQVNRDVPHPSSNIWYYLLTISIVPLFEYLFFFLSTNFHHTSLIWATLLHCLKWPLYSPNAHSGERRQPQSLSD